MLKALPRHAPGRASAAARPAACDEGLVRAPPPRSPRQLAGHREVLRGPRTGHVSVWSGMLVRPRALREQGRRPRPRRPASACSEAFALRRAARAATYAQHQRPHGPQTPQRPAAARLAEPGRRRASQGPRRRVVRVTGDSLFDAAEREAADRVAPLAVRMRPAHARRGRRPAPPARRRARRCAGWSRATPRCSVVLWGPPGTGKTTLAHGHRRLDPAPVPRAVGRHRRREGRPAGRRGGQAGARRDRRADGAVRRRGAPVLQDPAGRAAAERREPLGHPRRRDHREPLLQRHLARCCRAACCSPSSR